MQILSWALRGARLGHFWVYRVYCEGLGVWRWVCRQARSLGPRAMLAPASVTFDDRWCRGLLICAGCRLSTRGACRTVCCPMLLAFLCCVDVQRNLGCSCGDLREDGACPQGLGAFALLGREGCAASWRVTYLRPRWLRGGVFCAPRASLWRAVLAAQIGASCWRAWLIGATLGCMCVLRGACFVLVTCGLTRFPKGLGFDVPLGREGLEPGAVLQRQPG